MATCRSSAQISSSLIPSTLMRVLKLTLGLISSSESILEQYVLRTQALSNCWDVIMTNKRLRHRPTFYFPFSNQGVWLSQDTIRHLAPPCIALGVGLVMAAVSETSESSWVYLVKTKTHSLSQPQRCSFKWSGHGIFAKLFRKFWGGTQAAENCFPRGVLIIFQESATCQA